MKIAKLEPTFTSPSYKAPSTSRLALFVPSLPASTPSTTFWQARETAVLTHFIGEPFRHVALLIHALAHQSF